MLEFHDTESFINAITLENNEIEKKRRVHLPYYSMYDSIADIYSLKLLCNKKNLSFIGYKNN